VSLRLADAGKELSSAAALPADTNLLRQAAGTQSALAIFDIGKLQFLYITRLPSASSTQSNLRQTRSKKDHSEAARLAVGKRPGWSAVTSNTFVVRQGHGEIVLEGLGQGHGVGLCQRGASAMAQHSADFREIILHYFPNTTINQFAPRHQHNDR